MLFFFRNHPAQTLGTPDTLSWSPVPYACSVEDCSVEDCPLGMHQNLMFIPRKGTRRGLASRGKVLIQLTAISWFHRAGVGAAALKLDRIPMRSAGQQRGPGVTPRAYLRLSATQPACSLQCRRWKRGPHRRIVIVWTLLSDFSRTPSAFS